MAKTLYVNSVEVDRDALDITLVSLKKTRREPWELVFEENEGFDGASYEVEDSVELKIDGTTHFKGSIKEVGYSGNPDGEKVVYICLGLEEKLDQIIVELDNSIKVVYNAEKTQTDYDATRYDMEVGEVIDDLFDICDLTGTGISASPSGTSDMDETPPRCSLEGKTLKQAIDILLSYNSEFDYYVNPADGVTTFFDVTDLTAKTINLATLNEDATGKDRVLSIDIAPSTGACFTRCIIEGLTELEKVTSVEDGGISNGWSSALEATYTPALGADPTDEHYPVFRRFVLDDSNILPTNLFGSRPPSVLADNYFNYRVAYRAADWNLGDGVITLDYPTYSYNSEAGTYSSKGITAHYTYRPDPIQSDTGWVGTAYTGKGLKRPFLVWDNYLKKQSMRLFVYWTLFDGTNTKVYVVEALKGGINWGEDSDLRAGWGSSSTGFKIVSNEKRYVEVEGDASGLEAGDAIEIFLRDDSDKIGSFAENFIKQYKDLRYVGTVSINDIDTTFTLLHKINIAGSDNAELESINAPIRDITYDFIADQMQITLTDDKTISIEELRRRIFPKEKSSDFFHLEAGRHESTQGGNNSNDTGDKPEGGGGGGGDMAKHTHDADTDEAGGEVLSPNSVLIAGNEYIFDYDGTNYLGARYQ